jgi:hypothetical protein
MLQDKDILVISQPKHFTALYKFLFSDLAQSLCIAYVVHKNQTNGLLAMK